MSRKLQPLPQADKPVDAAIQANLKQGLALHQQGKIAEAERLYEEVLRYAPMHFDALHLLGVIALQTHRAQRSVELITRAIGSNPNNADAYYNLGLALYDLQRLDEALASYDKVISLKPEYTKAYNNRGNTLLDLKRPAEALASCDRAIALKPDYAEAYNNRGIALRGLKRHEEALASYDRAIALKPDYAEAYYNRGDTLRGLKRHEEALASYDRAIALKPDYAEAYYKRGNALNELKRYEEALASYDRAIALRPDYAKAYYDRGNALNDLKRVEEALASYDRAIALNPDYPEAYNNRGIALRSLKRHEEALATYDRAIALKPDYTGAYNNRGNALRGLKRHEEALASYDRAIALKPDYAEAYSNRGNALLDLKRPAEALASYDTAIALKPDYADAYNNRGNTLLDLKRPAEALASYDGAIALKPDYAEAYSNRGNALNELKRHEEALASYDTAIALKPDYAEAYNHRGNTLSELKRHEEAFAAYDKAFELKPDLNFSEGMRFFSKMQICDWTNFTAACENLISSVKNRKESAPPFPFLSIPSSSEDQIECAKLWVAKMCPSVKPIWCGERYSHVRIRIAYLSADFRDHPVSYLMAGVFEQHDRKRFETVAISFGPNNSSEMLARLKGSFDQFIDVKDRSDVDVARLLRELEIDIAIDLMGYTKKSRTAILARRPSPIQVNYLGFPGTMGADYIDYIIADRVVIPENQQEFYAEKVVYLPNSFHPTDRERRISDKKFTRADVGLPQEGFVFCCFNTNYKITPGVYDIWMRILNKVEGSVLWLFVESSIARRNLRNEAAARGVNAERVIFAPRMSLPEHQARLRLADLFLDTSPYNAGTTASDMLWAGLPVLTRIGDTFVGRMAASVLNAIGLPELITSTPQAYENLAIDLATNSEKLASIKRKLADNRLTTPLFDTQLFTKHIEAAYTAMYERYQAGLSPDHIYVPQ